jgi:hypothetical protein
MTSRRGELVRERRRQRGLPLSLADKVLPFRVPSIDEHLATRRGDVSDAEGGDSFWTLSRAEAAETRMAEAWTCLSAAELAGRSQRTLDTLEAAHRMELGALGVAALQPSCADTGLAKDSRGEAR